MAAQSAERDNRTMDSPQHHRTPHAMRSPGHVAPINLGLPLHAPLPAPGNDPFLAAPVVYLAPPAPAPAPAPASAPALAPVLYNGQQYNHLPAALAQQLAAIPPAPAPINLGHAPPAAPPAPAPAVYNGQQYNHLPAALSQQLAAIPPVPVQIGRGQGRGQGCGRGQGHQPNVVPPAIIPPAQGRGHGQGHGQGHGHAPIPFPALPPAPAPAAMVCQYNVLGVFMESIFFSPVSQSACTSSSCLSGCGSSSS